MCVNNYSYKRALLMYSPPIPVKDKNDEPASYEFDTNYSDNDMHLEVTEINTDNDDITYAKVVKSNNKTKKISNKISKNSKPRNETEIEMDITEMATNNSQTNESSNLTNQINVEIHEEPKKKKKKRISFIEAIDKIKEIILSSSMDWENKIKKSVCIIFEWMSTILLEYITRWPMLKFLINQDGE